MFLKQTLQGDFADPNSPQFQAQLQAAKDQIIPSVISQFAGAGRGTGGLAASSASGEIGNAFAGLLNQAQNRRMQALGLAGQFAQADQGRFARSAQQRFSNNLNILSLLLGLPQSTATSESRPGLLSILGGVIGSAGTLFGQGGPFGKPF
jgi:hypothetical protein